MLSDSHVKVISYFADSKDVFTSVDIKGGVAILYRDEAQDFGGIGAFTADPTVGIILNKVLKSGFIPLSSIAYSKSNYGFTDKLYRDYPQLKSRLTAGNEYIIDASIFDKMPELFSVSIPSDGDRYVAVYGRYDNKRVFRYINPRYIKDNEQLDFYKVLVTGANGTGKMGETLSNPEVANPNTCYTQTFMSFGCFDNKEEALALLKYIKTKFARLLLGTLKITQNNPREAWAHIPLQNFTGKSDIDWTASVAAIDKQLYSKYELTEAEIRFIEETIKPMDGSGYIGTYDLTQTYADFVAHFLEKYSPAKHNYFTDASCTQKNPAVSRTSEGLFCHHIDEDKAIMLSNDQFAAKNPFEYQKADRLVYCNILEHLLLHVKIAEEPRSADANQGELPGVGGAVTMICRQINDYFNGYNFKQDYMVAAMKLIEDNYDEYIRILKHLWTVIEGNPLYSQLIKKEDLAKGWDGKVIDKILVEL